jgi:type VI protein secretion system component VasF
MMAVKRTASAIILIIVTALSIVTWFVHNQISDLQNQLGALQA